MADKKVPTITNKWGVSRRDFGRGLTGIAGQLITGPLLSEGISAVSNLAKGSSILTKIPMTKLLIKEYFKIGNLKDKLLYPLEKHNDIVYSENTPRIDVHTYYNDLKGMIKEKNYYTQMLNEKDIKKVPLDYLNVNRRSIYDTIPNTKKTDKLQKLLNQTNIHLKFHLDVIEKPENKKQKKIFLKLMSLDEQQIDIRKIASDKKLPLNYYLNEVEEQQYGYLDEHVHGASLPSTDDEEDYEVLNEVTEEWLIDDAFEDTNKIEDLVKRYTIIDNPEEVEKIKQKILNNTFHTQPYSVTSMLDNPEVPIELKNGIAEVQAKKYLKKRKEDLQSLLESNSYKVENNTNWDYNRRGPYPGDIVDEKPKDSKIILNTIKEELTNVAKTIGTDFVKEQFITKELKPGPWTKKLADYVKSFKTPKAPSGPIIESDKIRAEQAKEVKEVKQETKIKTPPRNLRNDLSWLMRKGSPLFSLLSLSGSVPQDQLRQGLPGWSLADLEYQIEQDPKADEIKQAITKAKQEDEIINKEDKGRVSKDPNKTYNTQRFI